MRKKIRIAIYFRVTASHRLSLFKGIYDFLTPHRDVEIVADNGEMFLDWKRIREIKPDGVICGLTTEADLQEAKTLQIPVVNMADAIQQDEIPTVRVDNVEVGRLGAAHLWEQRFPHFAYLGVLAQINSKRRWQGFRTYLEEQEAATPDYYEIDSVRRSHARDLRLWLKSLPKPVGIMASTDRAAKLVLNTAHSLDLEIPRDMAMLGTGNYLFDCMVSQPQLSSVPLHLRKVGYQATSLLFKMLRGEPHSGAVHLIPPRPIVVRESTERMDYQDKKIDQAMIYIRTYAHKGINVTDVATAVSMSRRNLEIRFRKETQRTVYKTITIERLRRAQRLLVETDLKVEAVAHNAGFSESRFLIHAFRKHHGLTPGAFRKKQQPD